jgi:hypothetical protein
MVSNPATARGVRVTPTTRMPNALSSSPIAIPLTPMPTTTAVLPASSGQRSPRSQRCAALLFTRRPTSRDKASINVATVSRIAGPWMPRADVTMVLRSSDGQRRK